MPMMLDPALAAEFRQFQPRRILLTGADGMLGRSFREALQIYLPQCEVKAFDHSGLDVTDVDQLFGIADWVRDGWIIHCAGLVNVERCHAEPDLGHRVIVQGTANVCDLSAIANAAVFYPQTFLIYDGET